MDNCVLVNFIKGLRNQMLIQNLTLQLMKGNFQLRQLVEKAAGRHFSNYNFGGTRIKTVVYSNGVCHRHYTKGDGRECRP